MMDVTLNDLQASVQDRTAFSQLGDYFIYDMPYFPNSCSSHITHSRRLTN